MLKRAPRGGTYLLSRIRCAYAHAAEQGRIPDDFVFPTLGIKGAPQVRRKRAFTDAELATFIRWLPRRVLHAIFVFPSPMGEQHVG